MARHTMWALSGALLLSCSAVRAQQNSIQQVIPLKLYGQHLIVVQGSIGTLEKRNLVIDTGAYPSVIDRDIARKLHLSGHEEALDAVSHTVTRRAVVVPTVDVGSVHAAGVRSLVDDLTAVSHRYGVRIDALIGLDVLRRSSFRIDYAARKMFFGPVDPLPSSAPFKVADAMICVDLQAGGERVRLLVDTGAERVLLLGSRLLRLSTRPSRSWVITDLGGNFTLREISLDSLQLGDTTLGSQPILVSDDSGATGHGFDGFLSTAQFRQIAFDFDRQTFSWMAKDARTDQVRVASDTSAPIPRVAAFAGGLARGERSGASPDCESERSGQCQTSSLAVAPTE